MSAARLDALAQRVLRAAGWSTPLARAAEDDASGPAPHLDELERALGIRLPPPMTASGGGGGGGVRACTAPGEMWTWTPRTDAVHNAYAPACGGGGGDDGRATLEELAPFPPACYCSLGELAVEAFHPAGASPAAAGVVAAAATATTSFEALHGLERYSLPREMPSVRVARILLAWQELDSSDAGFFDRLLRGDDGGRRVPLLAALLRHWSALPRTEHGLRVLARAYGARLPTDASRYREYCAHCRTRGTVLPAVGPGGSVGDGGSTGGEWRPSPAVASFLGERALRVEALKLRLETEWAAHVSGAGKEASRGGAGEGGLPALLGCVYAASDAEARGRCRRWLGGWLRAFALGGGGVGATGAAPDGDCAAGHDAFGPAAAAFWPLLVGAASSAEAAPSRSFAAPRRGSPLGVEDTSAAGIDALLRILLRIVRGFQPLADPATAAAVGRRSRSLRPSHERLLFDVVLPLHRPEGLVLWRDQTPLLALYHETLVAVLAAFLAIDPALVGPVVGALLRPDVWPGEGRGGGNTPKTVLLLHEIDTLLGLPSNDIEEAGSGEAAALATALDACLPPLVARLCACIASENSRTAERALQFFRNRQFQRLVRRRRDKVGHLFLRALCRCPGWEVPWNPTVRKMTLLVLHELEGYYDGEESFGQACEAAFEGMDSASSAKTPATGKAGEKAIGTARVDRLSGSGPNIAGNMTSIRAAMGSWRPPSKAGGRPGNVAPPGKCVAPWASTRGQSHQGIPKASANGAPLTVTGVAPWAMTNPGGLPPQRQPPSTITGVAPWAMKKSESIPLPSRKSPAHPNIALPRPSKKHISGAPGPSLLKFPGVDAQVDIAEVEENNSYIAGQKKTALEEVRAYIEKLKPKGDDESNEDGVSSWAKVQMEESPVLLPHLKFHDLVFGQDLGTGAFGTVRYARHIVKTKTRSRWPEYAVKVVSTAKIKEMGYEQCVNREIATLRALSHPGIARLVSSFRFRDGAYLILEYASRGDLHSLLRRNGSLDHDSAGFVVGSVAAALGHVHDLGFVYGDCKPENILITETGHIKVTDFGGCRPVTQEAKVLVKESSKNLLKQLRDGDWKEKATNTFNSDGSLTEGSNNNDEDLRIEGTTAYLPPEVVIGGYPTTAADVWALGCVLFQCISGRPPILEETDELTAQRIVTFDLSAEEHNFFGEYNASTFRDNAKALIQKMLDRDGARRPCILEISEDNFFDGKDIFSLHRRPAHPLDVGSIAPKSDAKWSRRQFSTIWAPQPRAYNIGSASHHTSNASNSRNEPIMEGDEADEEFLPRQKAPLLTKIKE